MAHICRIFIRALFWLFYGIDTRSFPHRCARGSPSLLGCAIFVCDLSDTGAWCVSRLCDTATGTRTCTHLLFSGSTGSLSDTLDLDLTPIPYTSSQKRLDPSAAHSIKPHPVWRKLPGSLGYRPLRAFFKATFPLLRSGVIVSIAFVFLAVMKELPADLPAFARRI